MKYLIGAFIAAIMSWGACGAAQATHLLDLVDAAPTPGTPYSLSFVATGSTTTVSVGGYQVSAEEAAFANQLLLNGAGPNLLAQIWDFTPAPSGSFAGQGDDGLGTGANGLFFLGTTAGSFDIFSQTIATTIGQTYFYNFTYVNDDSVPNGFFVDASVSAVPGPMVGAGLPGLVMVFGGLLAWRRSNKLFRQHCQA